MDEALELVGATDSTRHDVAFVLSVDTVLLGRLSQRWPLNQPIGKGICQWHQVTRGSSHRSSARAPNRETLQVDENMAARCQARVKE